jgi:hypothetical protein
LLLAALVAGLAAPAAGAQPKKGDDAPVQGDNAAAVEEARKHFNEGVRLSAAGKVPGALDAFQKAYDIIPNWRILYNIGQTSRHVRDYARSLRAFERYVSEGKDDIPRARRAEVDKEIATLKPLVGRLEITSNVEGAEVFIDDRSVGTTPIAEPVLANGGKRRVRATKEGMAPFTEEVAVKGGGSQKLELNLQAATAATAPTATVAPTATSTAPPPDTGPPRDWSGYATAAWIGAAVFTAGAVATGTFALVESVRLADSPYAGPDRRPPPDSDLAAQGERIEVLAVVTDILVGAAVVSAGLGVYFSFFAGGSSSSAPPAKSGQAPQRKLTVRVSPKGAALTGSF